MTTYFSVPTPAGLAELASAAAAGQKVLFTHIAVGDGGGQAVDPTGRTSLVHEVARVKVASIKIHPANPKWLVIEGAIVPDKTSYVIREVALIGGANGTVMSVGNYPAVEMAPAEEGVSTGIVVRMVVAYVDAAAVSVAVDPQAYATLQTVLDQIAAHEAKANPHPQYLLAEDLKAATTERRGVIELATIAEAKTGTDSERAMTPATTASVLAQYDDAAATKAAAAARNSWAEQYFYATM